MLGTGPAALIILVQAGCRSSPSAAIITCLCGDTTIYIIKVFNTLSLCGKRIIPKKEKQYYFNLVNQEELNIMLLRCAKQGLRMKTKRQQDEDTQNTILHVTHYMY